jgi:hypothetical protein
VETSSTEDKSLIWIPVNSTRGTALFTLIISCAYYGKCLQAYLDLVVSFSSFLLFHNFFLWLSLFIRIITIFKFLSLKPKLLAVDFIFSIICPYWIRWGVFIETRKTDTNSQLALRSMSELTCEMMENNSCCACDIQASSLVRVLRDVHEMVTYSLLFIDHTCTLDRDNSIKHTYAFSCSPHFPLWNMYDLWMAVSESVQLLPWFQHLRTDH